MSEVTSGKSTEQVLREALRGRLDAQEAGRRWQEGDYHTINKSIAADRAAREALALPDSGGQGITGMFSSRGMDAAREQDARNMAYLAWSLDERRQHNDAMPEEKRMREVTPGKSTEQVLREALQGMVDAFHGLSDKWEDGQEAFDATLAALALPDSGDHELADKIRIAHAVNAPIPDESTGAPNPAPPVPLTPERVEELARDMRDAYTGALRDGGSTNWLNLKFWEQADWCRAAGRFLAQHPELGAADVSPAVAVKAVQDLGSIVQYLRDWMAGPDYCPTPPAAQTLVERICAVQEALREVGDGASAAPEASARP